MTGRRAPVPRRLLRAGPGVVLVAVLVAVSAAGCGAPGSTTPAQIEPTEVPYGLLDPSVDPLAAATRSDPPGGAGTSPTTPVFLLGPDGTVLQPAPAQVAGGAAEDVAAQALDRLEAGPSDAERSRGLGSALGAAVGLSLEGVDDGTARVELELTAGEIAADRVPFAIGQVVLTLTAVEGIQRVQVVTDGEAVEVALPGGKLTTEPVTAGDYEQLTVPGTD